MIQKDFILRLIEELAKAIAKILGLKKNKQYQEALEVIDRSFQRWLGLKSDLISFFSCDDLAEMMSAKEPLGAAKCILIAELLKEEADIYDIKESYQESLPRYLKSLTLFLKVFSYPTKLKPQKYSDKIDAIFNKLSQQCSLSKETCQNLFSYYEKTQRYAKAEDLLFELIDQEEGSSDVSIIDAGIAFYQRLIKKNDAKLIKGNLPREEVKEGLARLEQLKKNKKKLL